MPAPNPAAAQSRKSKKAGSGRKWLWILIACVLLSAGAGLGWWRSQIATAQASDKKAPVALRAAARYYALEPAFVVNLADEDAVRYLQADVQLVTRDPATLSAIEANAPAIRNRLLLLFGQQSSAQLGQRSGKERLQEAARGEVRQVLNGEGAADKIESVIFTSLVTQ
ncbi:flagellar basal body-associated FliL family protein [Luteimonas sp. 22616]|uniref:flagellar basal body-associated FliL family protein n=1 Tax=Luteimonas sp. 22616 TaxID=3453951 RepID=UPI003F825B2E